jgi:uncharacterized protein YraI
LRRLLLAAGLCAGVVGPSLADPAITTAWSNMRRAPSAHSRIVQGVPANAQIDLQGCGPEWCSASWRNLSGYIPAFAVAEGGAPPPLAVAPPPLVVAAPPLIVGPGYGWGGPYVGGYWGGGYGWRRW